MFAFLAVHRREDTVVQLIAAIRRVRRDAPGGAEVIAAQCTAHNYDGPGADDDTPGTQHKPHRGTCRMASSGPV